MPNLTDSQQSLEGSIRDLANRRAQDLAVAMTNAEVIVLFDSSSSMSYNTTTDPYSPSSGRSRYDDAFEALKSLQAKLPGRILLVSFNTTYKVNLDGIPMRPNGTTIITPALEYIEPAAMADMRLIVISDGEVNSPLSALAAVAPWTNQIDTIFIGEETNLRAISFMRDLARNKGQLSKDGAISVQELEGELSRLLLTDGR